MLTTNRPYSVRRILADPGPRCELFIRCIMFAQAMEGVDTTRAQATAAYDRVQQEAPGPRCGLRSPGGLCACWPPGYGRRIAFQSVGRHLQRVENAEHSMI